MNYLIVGLGNPGDRYTKTYHNIGFVVVDALARRLHAGPLTQKFKSLWGQVDYQDSRIHLLKPQTFMNLSGQAVAEAAGYYKIAQSHILVVVDDLDLPPGRIRLRAEGSAGGHNGLKSIIEALGTQEFARLRLGIGRADVLAKISSEVAPVLEEACGRAEQAILCFVEKGIKRAMNEFNTAVSKGEPDGT